MFCVLSRAGIKQPGRPVWRAFTLIELLVVIAIIMLLAGILLPVIGKARERARQADCKNNLHQFSLGVTMYKDDHEKTYPQWLSSLYPQYVSNPKTFLCRSDPSQGVQGGKPNRANDPTGTLSHPDCGDQYPETDDNKGPNINACSYLYEFSGADCDWWPGYIGADTAEFRAKLDTDSNGKISWQEAKEYQLKHGDNTNGQQPYDETKFPLIRCFWHHKEIRLRVQTNGVFSTEGLTLNVAYAGNIFQAPITWEHQVVE